MRLDVFLYKLFSTKFLIFSESGEFIAYGDTSKSDYIYNRNIDPNFSILTFHPISSNLIFIFIEKR